MLTPILKARALDRRPNRLIGRIAPSHEDSGDVGGVAAEATTGEVPGVARQCLIAAEAFDSVRGPVGSQATVPTVRAWTTRPMTTTYRRARRPWPFDLAWM